MKKIYSLSLAGLICLLSVNLSLMAGTVTSFTLINSDTDTPNKVLVNGDVIYLDEHINIRADVSGTVLSVKFFQNEAPYSLENGVPFALAGDDNGDYREWIKSEGIYTIRAVPYALKDAMGTPGTSLSISFTVAVRPGGNFWSLKGNAGTNPFNNFIGTTDVRPLVFRTTNLERMRLTQDGLLGLGTSSPGSRIQIEDGFRGTLRLMTAGATLGHDIGFDGGNDGFFWFSHLGAESGDTRFFWDNNGNERNLLVLKNTGLIGIGTPDPTQNLDVNGGTRIRVLPSGSLTDSVVVADNNGNLKRISVRRLISSSSAAHLSVSSDPTFAALTQTLREQQEKINQQQLAIEALKAELESFRHRTSAYTLSGGQSVRLSQCVPNPFSGKTVIEYFLPSDVRKASIHVYNMNGLELKKYELTMRGQGSLEISSQELHPGLYLYTLIVDGQEADTKRMVLTE
jgi:hypothetical protein